MERSKVRGNRESSRHDDGDRESDRRNHDKRNTRKSRSRSRDRKRDRNGRRASRSRSHDRKRDRGDKNDDRSRKSHRSDLHKDQNLSKSTHNSKSSDVGKASNYEVVEDYDDNSLKEIEDFITDENVDEIQEAELLAAERKLRREQILLKYNAEKAIISPTAAHLSLNKAAGTASIIEQNVSETISEQESYNLQVSTATSLAALVIEENKVIPNIGGTPYSLDSLSETARGDTLKFNNAGSSSAKNGTIFASNDGLGIKPNNGVDSSSEHCGNSGVTTSSGIDELILKVSAEILDSDALVTQSEAAPISADAKFLSDVEERLAEKNALRMDAQHHRESQPFDMFSSSPSDIERGGKEQGSKAWAGKRAMREALLDGEGEDPHLQSNWDDGDGYYKPRMGELIGDQYQTMGIVGKGVFSIVIKCMDLKVRDGDPVAIKVIRNNDTMRKAAEKERSILMTIKEKDPENKRHCVRLLAHFEFRNHVALVFDYQQMNLRETLKKFGKDVGINIGAVRMYARQLLVALRHLADLKIVHADIKLDNILCSGDLKQVKLCDFGSAFRETDTDNDPTPYLVSRFYRAPEIILGLPYDRAIDLWSVAVCLYELFTGHVMFPGRTNNEMLRLMMAVKGRMANKQLKNHFRAYEAMQLDAHFEERDLKFKQMELDPVTGKSVQRLVEITQPSKDLASVIRGSKAGSDDGRLVSSLSDLLDKCLALDPQRRISVSDSLKHPFFTLH